jgi:hypothetical protein
MVVVAVTWHDSGCTKEEKKTKTRDGRGRRLLLVDAAIPSKGLLVCSEALAYINQVKEIGSTRKNRKLTYLV